MRLDLGERKAAHLLAHGSVRLVHAAVAEGRGLRCGGDARREAGFSFLARAPVDQLSDGALLEGAGLVCRNPHLAETHVFALGHRDAAGDLRQVLGKGDVDDQALDIAETALGRETPRPAEHLAQRLDGGREPGEPVQWMLRGIGRRGAGLDVAHARASQGQHAVGGGERRPMLLQRADVCPSVRCRACAHVLLPSHDRARA